MVRFEDGIVVPEVQQTENYFHNISWRYSVGNSPKKTTTAVFAGWRFLAVRELIVQRTLDQFNSDIEILGADS